MSSFKKAYSNLYRFGEIIEQELKNIFEPKDIILLCFTEDMVRQLCEQKEICYDKVESEFKQYFLSVQYGSSFCNLSCCVLQVVIAYKCVVDSNNSYNSELCKFLDLDSQSLQNLYKQNIDRFCCPFQEYLWNSAKELLEKDCSLILKIPEASTGAGRYVQYPRKQRLFSLSDYKRYDESFKNFGKNLDDSFSFEDFSNKFFNKYYDYTTNRELNDLDKQSFEEVVKKIIFYCFCNYVEKKIKNQRNRLKKNTTEQKNADNYSVSIDLESRIFNILQNGKDISNISKQFSKILFEPFVYKEDYNDWLLSCKISRNDLLGLIIREDGIENYKKYLGNYTIKLSHKDDSSLCFFVLDKSVWDILPRRWKEKEIINKSHFIGGVKNSQKEWIQKLLPLIQPKYVSARNSVFVDSNEFPLKNGLFDLNDLELKQGIHVIRFADESPFELVVAPENECVTSDKGWTWSYRKSNFQSVDFAWIISGLTFKNMKNTDSNRKRFWGNEKMHLIQNRFNKIRENIKDEYK